MFVTGQIRWSTGWQVMRFNTYSNSLSFIDSTGGEGRSESDSHCSTFCCELENIRISHLMQDFFISMSGKVVWFIGILFGLSQIGLNLAPVLTGFGIAG